MATDQVSLRFKSDVVKVRRRLKRYPKQVNNAARRALNRTIEQVNRQAKRSLAKEIGLKQSRIAERLKVRRANFYGLIAWVEAFGKNYNIASFNSTRQTPAGVRSRAWGKTRVYAHSFLIQGGKTAMIRTGQFGVMTKGRYQGKRREKIRPVYGPKVPVEFQRDTVFNAVVAVAGKRWPINFRQQLRYALRGTGVTIR